MRELQDRIGQTVFRVVRNGQMVQKRVRTVEIREQRSYERQGICQTEL